MVPGNGVSLQFVGGNGLLVHGAGVQIKTTEAAVGNYNLLGAFMTSICYWYSSGYPNQNWHIWKKDLSVDNIIRKGDLITITNDYYANQCLYSPLKEGNYYLTTTTTPGSYFWRLM